ncbi:MAG: hypothetical protein M1830_003285 [Pleopsidium flavum]|nr:MAG: hypothetical protein M1830_003285 [Pleopsidium flavum]
MSASTPKQVAIIGAGLSGLSLALALHAQSIPCTIYELRSPSFSLGGAIMLSPNALRVLDSLGVYERIRSKGYNFESLAFKNEDGETTGLYYFGHQKLYAYKALRVYRQVLVTELLMMLKEAGISIKFEQKFSHVISESDDGVTFQFADGSTEWATLLIGADGIHSKVRRYVSPSVAPSYSGQLAITSAIKRSTLRFPVGIEYNLPVSISAKPGAFILAPQDVDGGEVLAGTQRVFPERDRVGWEKLASEKGELLELFRANMKEWPDIVQSALENIPTESITIWPYYTVPRLEKWASDRKRVIILGDAAHAIPPTAGQGVNQAFEDTYTLALLLSKLSSGIPLSEALMFWQTYRQERVDKVLDLTRQMNNKRLPAADRELLAKESVWQDESKTQGEGGQLHWLYHPRLDEEVLSWVETQKRAQSVNGI